MGLQASRCLPFTIVCKYAGSMQMCITGFRQSRCLYCLCSVVRNKSTVAYSHDPIHQATLLFGPLQSFHGPLVHRGGHPGIINVQQPEARHVDPAVAVRLQVQGEQILTRKGSREIGAVAAVDSQDQFKAKMSLVFTSHTTTLTVHFFPHQSREKEMVVLGHHSHWWKLQKEMKKKKKQ